MQTGRVTQTREPIKRILYVVDWMEVVEKDIIIVAFFFFHEFIYFNSGYYLRYIEYDYNKQKCKTKALKSVGVCVWWCLCCICFVRISIIFLLSLSIHSNLFFSSNSTNVFLEAHDNYSS